MAVFLVGPSSLRGGGRSYQGFKEGFLPEDGMFVEGGNGGLHSLRQD